MSVAQIIGLLALGAIIAYLYLRTWEDTIAGPLRYSRQERDRLRGWWYFDGWDWHREDELEGDG